MKVETIYLSMIPRPQDVPVVVHVSQGDTDFTIRAGLVAKDADFVIESGTSALIQGRRADGSAYTANITLNGKYAIIPGASGMTSVAGKGVYEVCLKHGGKELHTENFYLAVEPRPAT